MLNGTKIAKVMVIWGTILYVVCVFFAGILPSVYGWFVSYVVHFGAMPTKPAITFVSAIIGLILWDIVVYLAVWLFVLLYNKMK